MAFLYREFSNPESDTELNVDAIINHGLHFEKVSLGEFLTRGLLNFEKLEICKDFHEVRDGCKWGVGDVSLVCIRNSEQDGVY